MHHNMEVSNVVIFISLQTRNTELDKIKRELEEVKKDKLSLEEAKSWLERRLKETEVHTVKSLSLGQQINIHQRSMK